MRILYCLLMIVIGVFVVDALHARGCRRHDGQAVREPRSRKHFLRFVVIGRQTGQHIVHRFSLRGVRAIIGKQVHKVN